MITREPFDSIKSYFIDGTNAFFKKILGHCLYRNINHDLNYVSSLPKSYIEITLLVETKITFFFNKYFII